MAHLISVLQSYGKRFFLFKVKVRPTGLGLKRVVPMMFSFVDVAKGTEIGESI